MATINEVLDKLVTEIETALPAEWSKVYGYRTAPEKHLRYAMVTFMGSEDGSETLAGGNLHLDFVVVLFAQHDKLEPSKQAAERDLNEAEYEILSALKEIRNNGLWMKAVIPYPTIRPRQPRALPETRLAEIPVRLYT